MSARVLVVDDNDDILESLGDVLRIEGYEVSLANNGADALAFLHRGPHDVILLDLMMPGMDGREFRKQQLALQQPLAAIPVIVISADHGAEQSAQELGAVACLKKPMDLDALLLQITRCLNRASPSSVAAA